jgi:hypothetical protein
MRGVEGIPTVAPLEIDAFTPLRPGLVLHVNVALRRALGAGAANRFPTVGAFVDALEGRLATVDGEKTVRYRFASFRPRVTAMLLVLLGGVAIAAAYLDPGANRVARRGWRLASGLLGKPVAAPAGPGVRVMVLANDGSALPSAPESKAGRGPSAVRPTSDGPPAPSMRTPGPTERRSSPDLGPELSGGTSSQPTVTKQIAAGRRLASGSLDRAVAPKPATPAREAPVGPPSSGAGAFVRRLFSRLGAGASTNAGQGVAGEAPATEAATNTATNTATYLRVEAGGAALVTVDGIPRGAAPTTIRVSPGSHTVAVHAPGVTYTQSSTTVDVSRGTTTAVTFSPSSQRP